MSNVYALTNMIAIDTFTLANVLPEVMVWQKRFLIPFGRSTAR